MNTMKRPRIRHLFFVRADNDLDHFAPLIAILLKSGQKALLVSRDPFRDLSEDFRVKTLLKAEEHFEFANFIDLFGSPKQQRAKRFYVNFYWKTVMWASSSRSDFMKKAWSFVATWIIEKKLAPLQTRVEQNTPIESIAKRLIDQDTATVNFDTNLHKFTLSFAEHCSGKGLRTIALQHSIPHLASYRLGASIPIRDDGSNSWNTGLNVFDSVVVPNEDVRRRLERTGVESARMRTLGSLRFCKEGCAWIRRHAKSSDKVFKTTRKRVLLIASKIQPFIFKTEIFAIINAILTDSRFELVIKPHTRNGLSRLPKTVTQRCYIAHAESTVELANQSELILFWSTSFIYDPLVLGKPAFFLRYVYSLPFDFEKHISCWAIRHREDLAALLNSFAENGQTYSNFLEAYHLQREACIREQVLGGIEDVPGAYLSFYGVNS